LLFSFFIFPAVIFSLAPGGVLPDSRIRLDAKSFANGGLGLAIAYGCRVPCWR
jgi:hypothetical protein